MNLDQFLRDARKEFERIYWTHLWEKFPGDRMGIAISAQVSYGYAHRMLKEHGLG